MPCRMWAITKVLPDVATAPALKQGRCARLQGLRKGRRVARDIWNPARDRAMVRGARCNIGTLNNMALAIGAMPWGHWSSVHAVGLKSVNAPPFGDFDIGRKERTSAINSLILPTSFPALARVFPVRFLREYAESATTIDFSGSYQGSSPAKLAKFPVKFPVKGESRWRPVRSELRRQPASPWNRERLEIC